MKKFCGIMPALVSPLYPDESINTEALEGLIKKLKGQGAQGFYIGGATGEGLLLRPEERMKLCECAVAAAGKDMQKIVHITDMNFKNTEMLARHAEKAGADAISSIPPIYFGYTEDDIYNYYAKIASFVDIPLVIYYTQAAGKTFSLDLFKRLFEIDNITAVKWTNPQYDQMMQLKCVTNGEANIINGPDEMLLMGLAAGADGGIGTTYNFLLPNFVAIYKAFTEGNMKLATELQQQTTKMLKKACSYGTIPAAKAMVEHMGFAAGYAAFPQKRLSDEEKANLLKDMEALGWRA